MMRDEEVTIGYGNVEVTCEFDNGHFIGKRQICKMT